MDLIKGILEYSSICNLFPLSGITSTFTVCVLHFLQNMPNRVGLFCYALWQPAGLSSAIEWRLKRALLWLDQSARAPWIVVNLCGSCSGRNVACSCALERLRPRAPEFEGRRVRVTVPEQLQRFWEAIREPSSPKKKRIASVCTHMSKNSLHWIMWSLPKFLWVCFYLVN